MPVPRPAAFVHIAAPFILKAAIVVITEDAENAEDAEEPRFGFSTARPGGLTHWAHVTRSTPG